MFFKKKKSKKEKANDIFEGKDFDTWVKENEEKRTEFSKMADNNINGIELEKSGDIEAAKKIYEETITANFVGNHPYDRLAIIYRKEKDFDNEIRVLNHAIKVFSDLSKSSPRADVKPKLSKFKERLKKAHILKNKNAQYELPPVK
jgi:hypothetical protein